MNTKKSELIKQGLKLMLTNVKALVVFWTESIKLLFGKKLNKVKTGKDQETINAVQEMLRQRIRMLREDMVEGGGIRPNAKLHNKECFLRIKELELVNSVLEGWLK